MSSIYERRENGDGTYSANAAITDSDAILPMGGEYRKQKMTQTHSGINIIANSFNVSTSWIDTDGFDKVALTMLNDANATCSMDLFWSHDQSTIQGKEVAALSSSAVRERAGVVDTKARYMKVVVVNGDAAPHVFSSWIYLKV
jgi:hypothetical protein